MGPRTVLIVDPDTDSLEIYSVILERNGLRVLRARDVEEGFRQACQSLPDIVVLEIGRSPRLATPMLDRLRADPLTSHIRIIAVSTVMLPTDHPAREVCDGYLMKPCMPSRMLDEVRRFTGSAPAPS